MKKTINYEKDIIFKTNIGEICSISLEHDFTVDDGKLKGDFIVSGDYKANELSVNKESFSYRLPLEYELEDNVDIKTLSYDIENFEYNVKDDELSVYIDFGIRYEEKNIEPVIPEIDEKELNSDGFETYDLPRKKEEEHEPLIIKEEKVETQIPKEEEDVELPRLSDEDKDGVMSSTLDDDNFITYHVHIVREGESLETIALNYGVSVELIKEYNEIDSLEIKSKLIIPEVTNE